MSRIWICVGFGGLLGSVLRYALSGYIQDLTRSSAFSYGTLVVNVVGCFVIGFLSQLVETSGLFGQETRALLLPGFLGGFTTFSTFSNETMNLFIDGEASLALANTGAHILLGLGAVWAGRALAASIWR